MIKRFIFPIILVLFALAGRAAFAAALVPVVSSLDSPVDLASYLETIEDTEHAYTLEDIQSGRYDHLWQRNSDARFVGVNVKSKYWFRLTFKWEGADVSQGKLYLNIHPSLLYQMGIVFPVSANEAQRVFSLDQKGPLDSTDQSSFRYSFPLELKPGSETVVLGWARNDNIASPIKLPFVLMSDADLVRENRMQFGIVIAFYTLTFALFLYNGCLFIALRQSVYGTYLVFLACSIFMCAILDTSVTRYLFSLEPPVLSRVASLAGLLMPLAYLTFVVSALDGVRQWPGFNKVITIALALGVLCCIFNLFTSNLNMANAVSQTYPSFIMVLNLIIIVRAMFKGLPTAGYFFVAEVIFLTGTTSVMLLIQGVIPISSLSLWGLHWGTASEILLLSLALAARTRTLQMTAMENFKKYETLYENSIEGRFQYDLNTKETKCNQALCTILGYESPDDDRVKEVFATSAEDPLYQEIEAQMSKEGILSNYVIAVEHQQTREQVWISLNMRLIKDKAGKVQSVDGSITNISETKLKELAKKDALIQEAQNKAKSQFFATMSHELRTPLTAVLGYAEIASNPDLKDSAYSHNCEH